MSKNMTRKGLAVSSGLALVLTGLSSAPAFAADSITTGPGAGTSYITLDDQGTAGQNAFTLSTVMSPGLAGGNDATLHYLVSNPEGATLDIQLGDTTNVGTLADLDGDGAGNVGDIVDTATNTDQNSGEAVSLTSFVVIPAGDYDGNAGVTNLISIASDVATTIEVTAFLDTANNAGNEIDSVEIVGETREVTFLDKTDVTFTSSFVGFTPADTVLEGAITASPALNGNYANAENFTMKFTREGATGAITTSAGNWNNVTDRWEFLNTNSDEASLARGDENWVGLSSVYQVGALTDTAGGAFGDGGNDDTFTMVLDVDADLKTGDAIKIYDLEYAEGNFGNYGEVVIGTDSTYTAATKTLTIDAVEQDADAADEADSAGYVVVTQRAISKIAATKTTATITTSGEHGLSVGDVIDTSNVATAGGAQNDFVVADRTIKSVPSATTFTFDFATALSAAVDEVAATAGTLTYDSYDEVVPGDYTVQAYLGGSADANKIGAKVSAGSLAATAATVSVSATASASVTGNVINSNDSSDGGAIKVKAGSASSVDVVATVFDADGDAVGANRPVAYALSSRGATVTVNGSIANGIVNTDANGQVTFSVASSTGANGQDVTITLTPEGNSAATAVVAFDVDWVTQAFDVYDLNVSTDAVLGGGNNAETLTMVEETSMDLNLSVLDQWYQAPSAGTYSLVVAGEGVTDGTYAADAPVTLTVTDNGVYDADMAFNVSLFKGTTKVGTTNAVTVNLVEEGKVTLAADASSIYGGSTADLSAEVAEASIVEIDARTSDTATPDYKNNGVITGKVVNKGTSASLEGAVVTLSGPNNVLFTNGAVASRGSINVLTNSSGEFAVETRSTVAQEDTEITVSSLGGSATVDITFTGLGLGEATELVVNAPSNVSPAGTFQVTGALTDDFGNGVASETIKVTYLGPGITFGDLPTATDADGNFRFSVLLGANDTEPITVTVSYDQNSDGDYTDAKDLVTTKTITVGEAPVTQKVNAGSFKGYVAVYARGYEGQRLSAKIGKDWVIVDPIVNNEGANLHRTTDFTGAGVDIAVRIYIDRVLIDTINLTTK